MLNPALVERVLELLVQKLNLFSRVRDCTRQQQCISYFQDEPAYTHLVTQKDKLIKEINKLDVVLNKYLGRIGSQVDANTDLMSSLNRYNQAILLLAKEALDLELLVKNKLITELKAVKSRLHQVRAGRKGALGYIKANRINNSGAYTSSLR